VFSCSVVVVRIRKLKKNQRVVAIYMNRDGVEPEVRRGLVSIGDRNLLHAHAVDKDIEGVWLNFLYPDAEGVIWARGWYTPAARALRSAVALAGS
jgi:hypothetical protein